jgi:hydroxymethylpyrimidine pyrophosphatase-like HAD family hydrolase
MLAALKDEEKLLLRDGGVFYNGGCICCNDCKEYYTISESAVQKAIRIISDYPDLDIAVQMIDEKHSFRLGQWESEASLWGISKEDFLPFGAFGSYAAVKLVVFRNSLVYSPEELPEGLYDIFSSEIGKEATVYLTDKGKCIQVVSREISKKLAIDRICEKVGFGTDEIAVFGDDFTDMEMLKAFPHSFAMGNAIDEIKACARYTVPGNNDDGIHYALKNILKIV